MSCFIKDMNKELEARLGVLRGQYVQKCNTIEQAETAVSKGMTLAMGQCDRQTHSEVTGGHDALVKHPVVSLQ